MDSPPAQPDKFRPDKGVGRSPLADLNPLALLEGVIGGGASDWEPPAAEHLEPWFSGYADFSFIDRGGMGAVYAATQQSLDRRVAIKILPPELAEDTDFVERFHQEARLLAKLQHPHIVAIHDFGTTGGGHLFIVMEYVQGTCLLDIMKVEKIPVRRTLQIIGQVCDALQFAHDHGVIHRDIKPTNILIDAWGRVRVADFGLAKLSQSQALTTTSRAMGTAGYAAPEQRRAEADADHRADIFSVGVTLYELLTGHLPVGVFDPPSQKVSAPVALDRIVLKALRERPAQRYQRVSDMRHDMNRLLAIMEAPALHQKIIQRPLTALVIGVQLLVTGWLLVERMQMPFSARGQTAVEPGDALLPLNATFAISRNQLAWDQAVKWVAAYPGMRLAVPSDEAELRQLTSLLRAQGITTPLWIGVVQRQPGAAFTDPDGKPLPFLAWMPSSPEPPARITEFQAKNQRTLRDAAQLSPDWIEIFNPGQRPVDLRGWRLRHLNHQVAFEQRLGRDQQEPMWLQPGERRILFCDDSGRQRDDPWRFQFQLEAQGGRIHWADPAGNVIQDFRENWPAFAADTTIGCNEDGSQWGWCQKPTPGAPNSTLLEPLPAPQHDADAPRAALLLPDFDGRWSTDSLDRRAAFLVRLK